MKRKMLVSRIGQCLVTLVVFAVVSISAQTVDGDVEVATVDGEQVVKIRFDPFMDLCRGTYTEPSAITSTLYCLYDVRNTHSLLSPSKVEVLHNDPFVALIHDMVYDSEIEQLQSLGDATIKRSGPTNDSWLPVFYDNHQTYTLHDRDHPVVERLTRRIERATGLSCETAEDLKVIYNEVGAYRTGDIDSIQTKEDFHRFSYSGDRLATVLFFLSDVEQGGYTIFPKLRVAIPPRKGALAFWYNLKDTGEANPLMKYSICPLMSDEKWTAKKLIHTRGNELRHLCRPESAPNPDSKNTY
ncbi:prolyl 4-hydroxylase subunit alpha-1-like [Anopheles maculipalpis]|uniref:prolyl 4-hydroxylase subunit alpha-1-like n=1 Tax=Anopheles maculipalpis TaxID=1496333 RepID=UPI002158DFFF|nr:prolyl 4-hydroxylase subunit alpha-1-like [Anopheles maculipalpis]